METRQQDNYFSRKEELSEKALTHCMRMEAHFPSAIDNCILHTSIINPSDDLSIYNLPSNIIDLQKSDPSDNILYIKPQIEVVDMDSVKAIFEANKIVDHVTTLNFASFKNPGGKFLEGSSAQEESLCHESILYNVLSRFEDRYYKANRQIINNSLYINRALYTPDILFFRLSEGYQTSDIITCAAPNYKSARKYYDIKRYQNTKELKSRIKFIMDIANYYTIINHTYGSKALILGAFGCGVFYQHADEVATIFKKTIEQLDWCIFDYIIFAIPGGYNYEEFTKVFY